MLFGCICSVSLFLSTTALGRGADDTINEHNLFLLGPDGHVVDGERQRERNNRRRRGNGLRLLTMEEVETLPTMEYIYPESSCPPNSSLELRDKSDMPYMADSDVDDEMRESHDNCNGDTNCDNGDPPRTAGLCQQLLDKFHHHDTCSICLDEYEIGEQIRVLPCEHTFHSDCIFPWLTERSPTCPLCKAMFEAVRDEEEEGEGENERPPQEEQAQEQSRQGEQMSAEPNDAQPQPDGNENDMNSPRTFMQRRRSRRPRAPRRSNRLSNPTADNTNVDNGTGTSANEEEDSPSSNQRRWNSRTQQLLNFLGVNSLEVLQTPPLEEPLLSDNTQGNDIV